MKDVPPTGGIGDRPMISPTRTGEDVVRALLALETSNLLRFDPVAREGRSDEGVHQLRVSARRLRSELRAIAPIIRKKASDELDTELRWLGTRLGRQRDLDVMNQLFHSRDDRPSFVDESLIPLIEDQQRASRQRNDKVLCSKRYRRLIAHLSVAVVAPPVRTWATEPAVTSLMPGLRQVTYEFFSYVDALGTTPTNDELHQVRIRAKLCRYNFDIASSYLGKDASDVAASFEKIQTVLGDLHDRVVAVAFVRSMRPEYPPDVEEALEDPGLEATIRWLEESEKKLKTKWHTPLSRARATSHALLD